VGIQWIRIYTKEFTKLMAATYNITVNKNADFTRAFQVKENTVILDITSYTFSGRLKENFHATTHVDFTTALTDPTQGTFTVNLTDAQTAAMDPGTWVYDIIMEDTSGTKTRLLNGNAFVKQGVTP
jgi:hypothetical protein